MGITEELLQIQRRNKGILKADDVVEFARDPNTELHRQFDWEDTEAAHKWRLHQARNVIRINVSLLPTVQRKFRTFVSLDADRNNGGGYRSTVKVMSDGAMRDALIEQALKELESFRKRYESFTEFAGLFAEIDRVSAVKAQKLKRA